MPTALQITFVKAPMHQSDDKAPKQEEATGLKLSDALQFRNTAAKQGSQYAMHITHMPTGIALCVIMLMCSMVHPADQAEQPLGPITLKLQVTANTPLQYQFTTRLEGRVTVGNDEQAAPLNATVHTQMTMIIQPLGEQRFTIEFKNVQTRWMGTIADKQIQATLPAGQMDALPIAPVGFLPSTVIQDLQFVISSCGCLEGLMNSVRIGKYQCSPVRVVTQGHSLLPHPIRLNEKWQQQVAINSAFNPNASCQMSVEYQLTGVEGEANARSARIAYNRRVKMNGLTITPNAGKITQGIPNSVVIIEELVHSERGWLLRNIRSGIAHSGASSGQLRIRCKVRWIGLESRAMERVIKLNATTSSTFECASRVS